MQKNLRPADEMRRLQKLRHYEILDTEAEAMFDDLTHLAAQWLNVPIALISLVDENRQWFKSKVGLNVNETAREISFCQHAILGSDIFEVTDAQQDNRFKNNPLVTGDPNIRFYAGAPLMDDEGHAIGTLCAIDHQPRQLTEQERKTLASLSRTVLRTIQWRREMADVAKLSEAQEDFLTHMSHEIRTPLNAIVGFNKLLSQTPLNDLQKKYNDIVNHATQSLLHLINNILDVSKIEHGHLQLEQASFNLYQLLQDSIELFEVQARDKGILISCSIDDTLPEHWMGDKTRIGQIINNLMSNAIKFTEKGGVELRATGRALQERMYELQLEVIDSGIGIPEDKLHVIFNKFSQADQSTTRKYGGSGLGLHISSMLAQQMGGSLNVISHLGRGTAFYLQLPLEYMTQSECTDDSNNSFDLSRLQNKRLLIVEDNPLNTLLVETLLQRQGMLCTSVENGKMALDCLKNNCFDLVLLDLQMPVMDGFAMINHLRQVQQCELPIIACSAHASQREKEKCRLLGFNDYVVKPFNEDALLSTLLRYC